MHEKIKDQLDNIPQGIVNYVSDIADKLVIENESIKIGDFIYSKMFVSDINYLFYTSANMWCYKYGYSLTKKHLVELRHVEELKIYNTLQDITNLGVAHIKFKSKNEERTFNKHLKKSKSQSCMKRRKSSKICLKILKENNLTFIFNEYYGDKYSSGRYECFNLLLTKN